MVRQSATGLSVTPAAAAELRRLAFTLSAKLGRRVTLSAALAAAAALAMADIDATAATLTTGEDTDR